MFYELRMYHAVPGRLEELVERIGRVLPPFFERHGFPPRLGQWTVSAGPSVPMFVWLLRWPGGFEQRTRCFAGLGADQEWQAIRQRTNGTSEMVLRYDLRFLTASTIWPQLDVDEAALPEPVGAGLFELRIHEVPVGSLGTANEILARSYLPAAAAVGATILGLFENQTGPANPGLTMLLGWRSYDDRRSGLRQLGTMPDLRTSDAIQVLGPAASILLESTPYGHPNFGLRPSS
ncbi:NIPSNAP family protein [Microvirga yunnanensis]|uniref:NIPSNAP family protein n=1 Tax=Microvirga yunnanensis TaxID=2953740 RepID=UPI0035A0553A